jgi:hypothetical protein
MTSFIPQSLHCSWYVIRPILASPPLWLQKHTDLRALSRPVATLTEAFFGYPDWGFLRLPWLRFFRALPSVVRQMPGYNSQRLDTANTLPNLLFVLCLFVIRVVLLLIVMFCVLFMCKCVLPPGANPIAVDKYIKNSKIYMALTLSWVFFMDFCLIQE